MKNLKDYLNKKVAIACRTDEEAEFVNNFLENNGGRSLIKEWYNRKNNDDEYHNCIEFDLNNFPYNCYCQEGYYKEEGYTVYEASEFINTKDSLLEKARRDYPIGSKIKCLHNTNFGDIDTGNFEQNDNCIRHKNKEGYFCCVYYNNEWATIIEQPKEEQKPMKEKIKEWSVGTYVVFTDEEQKNAYNVDLYTPYLINIENPNYNHITVQNNIYISLGYKLNKNNLKWFATKEEAEAFSRELLGKSNSIPEYVECISCSNTEYIVNKIYKTIDGRIKTENNYLPINKYELNEKYYGYEFKKSTKAAYEAQGIVKEIVKQHPLTTEQCMNEEVIEIGDEVEVIDDDINYNHNSYKKGYKFIVTKKEKSILSGVGYWINHISIKNCKLIKKASHNTNTKKVDVSSPKVGNKLLMFKKRESTTLPNVEKRVKLKIFKQKLIKI
jgi:hypothetical protein